ncbi:MAG: hypothetical protein Q8P67_16345 [archaeon]|nr:hypothetical protein [archaeon]
MCRSDCVHVNEVCFPALGNLLDCKMTDPIFGGPLWPADSCLTVDELLNGSSATPVYPCPPPLLFAAPDFDPYTGLPCSTTCHDKIRQFLTDGTDDHFAPIWLFFAITSWFSFIAVTLTLTIYFLFPENRRFPRVINMWLGVGMFVFYLGLIGLTFRSPDESLCKSEWALEDSTSWCQFQGWSLMFGALMLCWYWTFSAINMFWNVALMRYKDPLIKRLALPWHIFTWTYCLVTSLVVTFVPNSHAMQAIPSFPYCFFNDEGLHYGLFRWPFYLGVLVVSISSVACLIRIATTAGAGSKWSRLRRRLSAQLTIFAFMVVWLLAVVSTIMINTYFDLAVPKITESLQEWYGCIFTTPRLTTDCQISYQYNLGFLWFHIVMMCTVGLWYSFIYLVLNPNQQSFYRAAILNCREGRPFNETRATATNFSTSRHSSNSVKDSSIRDSSPKDSSFI